MFNLVFVDRKSKIVSPALPSTFASIFTDNVNILALCERSKADELMRDVKRLGATVLSFGFPAELSYIMITMRADGVFDELLVYFLP